MNLTPVERQEQSEKVPGISNLNKINLSFELSILSSVESYRALVPVAHETALLYLR